MPTESMRIDSRRQGGPLGGEDIAQVEQRLGVVLPRSYVEFLREQNGGIPIPDGYQGIDPDDVGLIHFFYSVDGSSDDDLVGNVEYFWENGVPRWLMPIARTPSGTQVCLHVGSVGHGAVYLWSDAQLAKSAQGWRLATDLASFVRSLHEVDIDTLLKDGENRAQGKSDRGSAP